MATLNDSFALVGFVDLFKWLENNLSQDIKDQAYKELSTQKIAELNDQKVKIDDELAAIDANVKQIPISVTPI